MAENKRGKKVATLVLSQGSEGKIKSSSNVLCKTQWQEPGNNGVKGGQSWRITIRTKVSVYQPSPTK